MFDSPVIDLMFAAGASLDPALLVEALGGEEAAAERKILDPDMQDPRLEMEMSPSRPFRQRNERRLMIIDATVSPMREDPQTQPVVPVDLRPERERLIALCETFEVRFGRLFALGTWGEAVMVARTARDLRGVALLSWLLDPTVDIDGNPYGRRLTQAEFEAKLAAYGKRLDEMDEEQILARLGDANVERRGELLIVDVLSEDGTWDTRKSLALERALSALDRFSMIPGAPAAAGEPGDDAKPASETADAAQEPTAAATETSAATGTPPKGGRISAHELDGQVVLEFPEERFDLDVAAALGKKDYSAVLHANDDIDGRLRDQIFMAGADFIAPLEFLSEVFLDGRPLMRKQFDEGSESRERGVRTMDVHCPRYGAVTLLDIPDRGRFITSARDQIGAVLELLSDA